MARVVVRKRIPDRDRGRCYVGIVVDGAGRLTGPGCDLPLQTGATFFVPAASEHAAYEAPTGSTLQVVKCFPPAF
jgi:mannose-6-phosphate isomerase class I